VRSGALAAASALGLLAAEPCWAGPDREETGRAEAGRGAVRTYDIPAQSLAGALTQFGVQSGLQVTVDGALLAGLTTRAVRGALTPDHALAALLAGTGMSWRFSGPATVLVERGAAPAPAPAPAPTAAAPAAGAAIVLAPVTVTGERMQRSLMETASSVAVVEAATLDTRPDLAGTNSLTEGVPNIVTLEPSNYAPTIRGIDGTGPSMGAYAFFAGVRPRLTVQVDGRPTSFNEMVFGDVPLWDVEQVEMFRGPQSTVQGRNSIAGAIVVKTKDPTYTPEGKVRAIIGNHNSRQVSGMLSGPVVEDQVAVRLAVDHATSESDLAFAGYAGMNHPDEYRSTTLRAKLLLEPKKLDGFRNLLTVTHTDYQGPQAEYVKRPFGSETPQSVNVATFNPRTTSGILETTLDIRDGLTLENRLAVTDFDVRRHSSGATGNVWIDGNEGMVEPHLNFTGIDGRLRGFGGYYGLRSRQKEYIDLQGGHNYHDETTTNAVFGESTLALTDRVDLTTGGRLEHENRRRVGGRSRYAVDFDETYAVFLPKLGAAWHVTDHVTTGAMVSRGFNGGGAGVTFSAPFVSYAYQPEYAWNYEVYARSELLGGALRLNGNLFLSDYKNLQLPLRLSANSSVVRNAEAARTYGAEADARWLATDQIELFGALGLLQTEVLRYAGSDYEGNQLPHAPALTASAGVTLRPLDGLELGADLRYSEAYYSDITNTPRGRVDPYWVVNLHAGYEIGPSRLFAYARNLFDTETPIDIFTGATAGADYASMLKARSFGAGVEVSF